MINLEINYNSINVSMSINIKLALWLLPISLIFISVTGYLIIFKIWLKLKLVNVTSQTDSLLSFCSSEFPIETQDINNGVNQGISVADESTKGT